MKQQRWIGQSRWEAFQENAVVLLGVLAIIALILVAGYWDFQAYHQRFPQAEAWTYFFQHR